MIKLITSAAMIGALITSGSLQAREVQVQITNLTNATYFTPLLVAAHRPATDLFELGTPASDALQAMAEGGDISMLADDVELSDGVVSIDPAMGLLAPGDTATTKLKVSGKRQSRLSVTAMLLPTNDGFVGLDAWRIPRKGTHTLYLYGYDAGTEGNDELITGGGAPGVPGIPADPGGYAGSGGMNDQISDQNTNVHLHPGIVGDFDPLGGESDLNPFIHRWQGPVARLIVQVTDD